MNWRRKRVSVQHKLEMSGHDDADVVYTSLAMKGLKDGQVSLLKNAPLSIGEDGSAGEWKDIAAHVNKEKVSLLLHVCLLFANVREAGSKN